MEKFTTKNVAISIPVTSAIIEVVKDLALMTEAELKKSNRNGVTLEKHSSSGPNNR